MRIGTSLTHLAEVIDQLETSELEIYELTPQNEDLLVDDTLTVDATVAVSDTADPRRFSGVEIACTNVAVTDKGRITFDLSIGVTGDASSTEDGLMCEIQEGETEVSGLTDGGTLLKRSNRSVATERDSTNADENPSEDNGKKSTNQHRETARTPQTNTQADTNSDTTQLAYKDPERLKAVYDSDKTFEEMRDKLGVDVTPQTVRNYMIEYGIHEPNTTASSSSDDETTDPSPEATCDSNFDPGETAARVVEDVELPSGLRLCEVTDAVSTAKTLYEVQRELDMNRDQTQQLLQELNLLDLVHGRLTTTSAQTPSRSKIESRIQTAIVGRQSDK